MMLRSSLYDSLDNRLSDELGRRPGIQEFGPGQILFSSARYASQAARQNVVSTNLPRRVVSISPQDSSSFK